MRVLIFGLRVSGVGSWFYQPNVGRRRVAPELLGKLGDEESCRSFSGLRKHSVIRPRDSSRPMPRSIGPSCGAGFGQIAEVHPVPCETVCVSCGPESALRTSEWT